MKNNEKGCLNCKFWKYKEHSGLIWGYCAIDWKERMGDEVCMKHQVGKKSSDILIPEWKYDLSLALYSLKSTIRKKVEKVIIVILDALKEFI